MEDNNNAPLKSILRQKAEELLQKKTIATIESYSDDELSKLIDELETYNVAVDPVNSAQVQLIDTAENSTNLCDCSLCGYITITNEAEILEVNCTVASILGKPNSDLLHNNLSHFISEKSKPTFFLFLKKIFETKSRQSCEIILSEQSETSKYISLTGDMTKDSNHCLLTMVDISGLIATEHALQRSDLLLNTTIENINETIIFSVDTSYCYLSFNNVHLDEMKQFYNTEVKIGKNSLDCFTSLQDKKAAKENYDKALQGESHSNITIYGVEKKAHFECHFCPIIDHDQQIIGVTVLANNVTNLIEDANNLKVSQENLQSILDSVSEAIYVIDKNGNYIDVNKSAEKMYLCSREELIGKSWKEFAVPGLNDFDELDQLAQNIFENGESSSLEFWAVRKNGEIFPKEIVVNKAKYLGEEVIISSAREITDRKKIENSLKQSQEKLLGIFNVANSGILLCDNDEHFIMFNDWICKLLDYSKAEFQELNAITISHPDDVENSTSLQKKLANGEIDTYRIEKRLIKKDNSIVWCDVSASVIKDENETVINTIKVIYDITNRKQAEQELISEKQRLALILLGTGAGTWELNIQTGALIINDRWAELFGYTVEELLPISVDTWRKHTHTEDLRMVEAFNDQYFKNTEEHYYEAEFRMKHKNGHWVWILSRGAINERDLDGNPLLMSGTHLDITERKLAEEKLISSENLLKKTQSIANLGSFTLDFTTQKWTSCSVLDQIYGINSTFERTIDTYNLILHPDWVTVVNDYLAVEVIGKRNNFNKEYKIVTLDRKEEKWVHCMGKITFDNDGSPQLLIGSVQDITERKIIEEKLKLASEKFEELVSSSEGIIWEADAETLNFTYVSNQAKRLLGFEIAEWYEGGFLAKHLHPDDKQNAIDYCQQQKIKMHDGNFIFRFIAKNGEILWLRKIVNVVTEDGIPRWLRGVMFDVTNLQETNLLLTESEEKYRGLVENAPYGIIIYVRDTIAFINAEVLKMAQAKDKDELIGRSVLDFVHPDSMEDIVKRMAEVHRDTNASENVEARLMTIGGNPLYVELKVIPTVYEHQQAVQVIIQDISFQKQSALDLNKINRVYALISQINNLIIRTHNREQLFQEICNIAVNFGKFRMSWIGFLNDDNTISTAAFAGFENGYFEERAFTSFCDVSENRGPTRIALNEGRAVICNNIAQDELMEPFRKEALERGYYSMMSIPIRVRNKNVAAFNLYSDEKNFFSSEEEVSLLEKITLNIAFALESILVEEERKQNEQKIRQLSQAVEQSPATTIITDINGYIEYVNPKFVETTGYTLAEVFGKNPRMLTSNYSKGKEFKQLWKTIRLGKLWQGELYNKKKDGTLFWESSTVSPLLNEQGIVTHYIAINENITDRKIAEQELIDAKLKAEESDRLKLAFLANMSHEIRTPMNGILGFTELLKAPNLSGKEQNEFVTIIEKSGQRMLNIINDIISISKVEAGQIEVTLSETNLNEQLYYIHSFFEREANQKGIQLIIKSDLPPICNIVLTDSEKLYAILTNLVKNAIKFTNEGSIEFGCEKKAEFIAFFVKDSGIGISESQQNIVFERFRQASESVSRSHEGSGLGLAISKAYIEKMGGKIWVESEKGKGSTFYFTIPFQSEYNQELENDNMDKTSTEKENLALQQEDKIKDLKVLIVEDDPISKLLLTFVVKSFSKEILKVSSGIEAIEACRSNPDIDLVMMDVNMPIMGGYEATQRIREFNKDLVIIAQTANALQTDRNNAIEAGCTDYISKPINIEEFTAMIQKYFKK